MSTTETKVRHTANFYQVKSDGSVWSSSGWRGKKMRQLVAQPNSHGYMRVRMVLFGMRVSCFVHKLVAQYYLPPRPTPQHEIRHLDGNRQNNLASNLAWGTRKDNAADRATHGRTSKGEKHATAIKAGLAKRK